MDGFARQADPGEVFKMVRGAGTCMAVISCICSLACLSIFLTFVIYLGIYAFDNPDNEAWYQSYSGPVNGETVEIAGLTPTAEFPAGLPFPTTDLTLEAVPVHARFVTWFTWGFLNTMLCCTFCCGAVLISRVAQSLVGCCFCLMACTNCSGFVWYIMGLVWRLNKAGRFASGDILPYGVPDWPTYEAAIEATPEDQMLLQLQSGQFMWVYFVISWVLMGTACVCGCIAPCLAACLK